MPVKNRDEEQKVCHKRCGYKGLPLLKPLESCFEQYFAPVFRAKNPILESFPISCRKK
jgi:hypothetical protein